MNAATTTELLIQNWALSQQDNVQTRYREESPKNKTMPGLRIGLQTLAVSNGYDPSFQQHAKFGPLIK